MVRKQYNLKFCFAGGVFRIQPYTEDCHNELADRQPMWKMASSIKGLQDCHVWQPGQVDLGCAQVPYGQVLGRCQQQLSQEH